MNIGTNIPNGLVEICKKDGRVVEITNELWSDGDHLNNYWLILKDGWSWCDCGSIHENTVKDCRNALKNCQKI